MAHTTTASTTSAQARHSRLPAQNAWSLYASASVREGDAGHCISHQRGRRRALHQSSERETWGTASVIREGDAGHCISHREKCQALDDTTYKQRSTSIALLPASP
eukprot:359437-Chlamydomonas_euryale.AAC.3